LEEKHLEVGSDLGLFGELAQSGAVGVLLPGVDGDVAGLYSFTTSMALGVRAALEDAARIAGTECVVATADDFRELIRA
jgi:hypothetical protein